MSRIFVVRTDVAKEQEILRQYDKREIDWDAIKTAYDTRELTVDALCSRHGITRARLYRRIGRDGWIKRSDAALVAAPLDIADPSYVDVALVPQGLGLRPLAPVHVKAALSGNDLVMSWIRQTRIGGDNWQLEDVPLGEGIESYQVDVMDGASTVRTISTGQPTAIYTLVQQIADWGAQQTVFDLAIYQLSASYGRGAVERITLNV